MVIPTIAMYGSPVRSVYTTPHHCQINSHDFDLSSKSSSSTLVTTASTSSSHKAAIGGLSCLFSPSSVKHTTSISSCGDEMGPLWHDKGEEFGSSFGYSHYSMLKRDQSPVSVLHGPVSCSSSSIVGSGRSPSSRISRERLMDVHANPSIGVGSNGVFTGFIRSAVGSSCVDYDPPILEAHATTSLHVDSSSVFSDELTFKMDDGFMEMKLEQYAKELLKNAQSKHKIFCEEFVIDAFIEAEKAHHGQVRASGDPYLQHCVETATLLALIGANSTLVAAGLLHDTIDDSFLSYDYILRTFGPEVADLVRGVSKLSHLSKLARENNTASKTVEADRMHTMFLAMADARAVLVKLADRLHNMMTLDALPFPKRQRFAKETLEIFAPLANRLGVSSWKEQLENLCFKHLNSLQYGDMSAKLVKSYDVAMIPSAIEKLEKALEDGHISYSVLSGRHKSLYSIYCKMVKKKLSMDEIHDIHGLRLIVDNKEDCYKALKVVNTLWSEVPGRFKDYIAEPKPNGYESFHSVVMGEGKVPLEIQIRTKAMHLQAEFGFAAHWRYKEGDCKYSSFVLQMVEWARWVVTWQCETMSKDGCSIGSVDSTKPPCSFPSHSEDCPYSYKSHCSHNVPVFVILIENEKMSVQEFPCNSTMNHLLERAGRGSSKRTPYRFPIKEDMRPRLNNKPVNDPSCKLQMGDVVELTPAISDKSLIEYREEIQRMYGRKPESSKQVACR